MALKRECDICGRQVDESDHQRAHFGTRMYELTLPTVNEGSFSPLQGRSLDACGPCMRRVHEACERIPQAAPSND